MYGFNMSDVIYTINCLIGAFILFAFTVYMKLELRDCKDVEKIKKDIYNCVILQIFLVLAGTYNALFSFIKSLFGE